MDIEDQIRAAVKWRHEYGTQGQDQWETKNSAALKTRIGDHEIISNAIYLTVPQDTLSWTWIEYGHKVKAILEHVAAGNRDGELRLCLRIEDHG